MRYEIRAKYQVLGDGKVRVKVSDLWRSPAFWRQVKGIESIRATLPVQNRTVLQTP